MEPKDEKKERVLHTRVSESLEEDLKRRAAELGTSVSNLVRNVLQNTFEMVGDIVHDAGQAARAARGGDGEPRERTKVGWVAPASGSPPAREPRLIGWQELFLELNAVCDRCNQILSRGTAAAVGVYDPPGPRAFLCAACLERLRGEPAP